MIHEVDECIVKILCDHGPLSSNRLREKVEKETGRTPNTIYNRLRILKRDGIICRDPHDLDDKTNVWYYLSDDKSLLCERKHHIQPFLTGDDKKKEGVPYEIKKAHTKDIQEKVIQPWIEKMPFVCWDGIFILGAHPDSKGVEREVLLVSYGPEKEQRDKEFAYPKGVDLDLFEDFKDYHIYDKIEGNPFNLWEKFLSLSCDYWHKFEKIITGKLPNFIESHFKDDLDKMDYPELLMTILLGFWEKAGCSRNLISPRDKRFILFKVIDHDIHYDPNIIKKTDSRSRKNMIESKFGKSALSVDVTQMANEIVQLLEDINHIKNQLNRILNKYSHVQYLPGDCPYI